MSHTDNSVRPLDGSIYTAQFWAETGDRAIKSAAAALLAKIGDDVMDFYDLGWDLVWKLVVVYLVVSVLGSLISAPFGRRGSASVL